MRQRPVTSAAPGPRARQDVALAVGVALIATGILATAVTLLPLFTGAATLPLPWYLLSLLAPVGFGVILVTLWRRARARGVRVREASRSPDAGPRP
jgi:Na+/proline symporter